MSGYNTFTGYNVFTAGGGAISVVESVVNSNFLSLNPDVELKSTITINESLVNSDYTSLNPAITLSGLISINEKPVNTVYKSINPLINVEVVITAEYTGILKSTYFSGTLGEEINFNGYIKAANYKGVL